MIYTTKGTVKTASLTRRNSIPVDEEKKEEKKGGKQNGKTQNLLSLRK